MSEDVSERPLLPQIDAEEQVTRHFSPNDRNKIMPFTELDHYE